MKYLFLFIKLFFLLGLISSEVYAGRDDREIEHPERLAFLSRATGSSSSSSPTFQNRLNAILDTTPTRERAYVVAEEAQERRQLTALETLPAEEELEEKDPDDPRLDKKDDTKVQDASYGEKLKEDASQDAFEKTRSEIQKEFDERNNPNSKKQTAEGSEEDSKKGDLPPWLANNPFYQKENYSGTSPDDLESRKPIIISRLVAMGMDQTDAAELVRRNSSEEAMVIELMEAGFDYGQSSEAVSS